jgi:hypothetical protein
MNKTPTISLAGTWKYSTTNSQFGVVAFYSQIKLGAQQNHGLVLGGWAYSGWGNTSFNPVNIAILDQQPNGTLKVNTAKYISDPLTNGEGSVIVSDFNGDGFDDIFLAAHNESPDIDKSSTAYVELAPGKWIPYLLMHRRTSSPTSGMESERNRTAGTSSSIIEFCVGPIHWRNLASP